MLTRIALLIAIATIIFLKTPITEINMFTPGEEIIFAPGEDLNWYPETSPNDNCIIQQWDRWQSACNARVISVL